MKIEKNTAVTLRIRMLQIGGKPGPANSDNIAYLHGGYDNIFAKLEALLEGQEPGFSATVDLSAAEAFGERDPALTISIAKSDFPPGVKVGGHLERGGVSYNVIKIKGPQVLLDGNHPLAGNDLRMNVTVLEVRAASEEEIAHGHVHGAHGHHH
jgi:FKBP-type peptidyl-prolyl cis-trans isomerase SlyD